jgi:hypothetical protein
MKWVPEYPVQSSLQPRLSVNDYKSDLALDFGPDGADLVMENGDLKMVSGKENFIQTVKKVLLSNKTPLFNFGLQEFLPKSTDQNLFNQECLNLANELVSHEFSDSQPDNPNGLGYTIESINSIEYDEDKEILFITMKATGIDDLLTIDVPVYLLKHK